MNLVKQSLYLCIGVLLALVLLQGLQSLWQVSRMSGSIDAIVQGGRLSSDAHQLWTRFLAAEEALKRGTAFVDAEGTQALRTEYQAKAEQLRAAVAELAAHSDDASRAQAESIAGKAEAWLKLAAPHIGVEGVAELPSYHRLDASRETLESAIGALLASSGQAAAAAAQAGEQQAQRAYTWTIVEMLLALALGVSLGWFALRSLRRQLGADASEVAELATAVANGNLSMPSSQRAMPPGSVMAALTQMQGSLVQTVTQVRAISDRLLSGATEIADGNTQLNQRTEEQALAIEKTASTMEQLGATVSNNAASATDASTLAAQASSLAERGGIVVGRAVDTMRGISDSSKKIAEIVGVIDGIAFQTNILALNAAVEAARAGEQGRGFAVVAGEVRQLAQRSASAAKEIKQLIGDSVGRVEQGASLVDEAGKTMQEVVASIQRVSAKMSDISAASNEQAAGVAQVGDAVTKLDQATQQNAGLAQQTAAAARSLTERGTELIDAVAVFKLQRAQAA